MKKAAIILVGLSIFCAGMINDPLDFINENHQDYVLHYTSPDKESIRDFCSYADKGIDSVVKFFGSSFKNKFDIYIFPDRQSIDNQWATDWKIPGFKSECWMVASGVAARFDIISPRVWNKESCEHKYENKVHVQQIITHELIHVFQAQVSNTVNYEDFTGLDWFVEGLATYVSGQCSKERMEEIRKAIEMKEIPASLDDFWKGKMRYGLSGSTVMYIDNVYGREKLKEVISIKSKTDLLASLKVSEQEFLSGWESYLKKSEKE